LLGEHQSDAEANWSSESDWSRTAWVALAAATAHAEDRGRPAAWRHR